jgi:hypothetical protein
MSANDPKQTCRGLGTAHIFLSLRVLTHSGPGERGRDAVAALPTPFSAFRPFGTPLLLAWLLNQQTVADPQMVREGLVMPQSTYRYRGYLVGLQRRQGHILVAVSPETPDLPILHRCMFEIAARSEIEAMAEARNRVDRVCASTDAHTHCKLRFS